MRRKEKRPGDADDEKLYEPSSSPSLVILYNERLSALFSLSPSRSFSGCSSSKNCFPAFFYVLLGQNSIIYILYNTVKIHTRKLTTTTTTCVEQ